MRKLIESTLVSVDGVIESPERWAIFDDEATQRSMQELDNYDAFVMGRITYERFRENWSASGGNPYFDRIAAMSKYVASRSLAELTWNVAQVNPHRRQQAPQRLGRPHLHTRLTAARTQ